MKTSNTLMNPNAIADTLRLSVRAEVKRMFAKTGSANEKVIFSDLVTKINKRGREQRRVLLVTNRAVYNMKPNDFTKCKRRIALENVISITVSEESNEFVVHVPDEYDYRFKSEKKKDIVTTISSEHQRLTGRKIFVHFIGETVLKNLAITKDKARLQTREDIMKRKSELAAEDHVSDHEEDLAIENYETTQILPTKEKLSLEHFDLLQVIGRGSFGKVMLVRKKDDQQTYAMKILKKTALIARHQVEHTKSERRILQCIEHPFLIGLRYAFQTSKKLYFVLDYYKGGELFFHLKHKRRFSEYAAQMMVAQVGLALGHLHSNGIVYRDLKPENILMDNRGYLCLTDFGLSKDLKSHEKAFTFCGTPEYLAPEVVRGGGHSQAVDWWSLGILLYELTVGIPPFYSQNVHEMYQKIQTGILRFPPFLTDDCKDLISRLLHRNPKARLGSAGKDFAEIRSHHFFDGLDFDALLAKSLYPPYVPHTHDDDDDTSNFEGQFTNEPVVDSFVQESYVPTMSHEDTPGFGGFTYHGETKIPC